jgi:hypothetical protein
MRTIEANTNGRHGVSGNYQNYQNGAVSNQLTDVGRGRGESVLGVTVNLLMCDRGGCTVLCAGIK